MKMFQPISPESNDSDLLYLDQSSSESSPPTLNRTIVLNSTEMSVKNTQEKIALSSIASLGSQIVTIDNDLNEPTIPY